MAKAPQLKTTSKVATGSGQGKSWAGPHATSGMTGAKRGKVAGISDKPGRNGGSYSK